ncbi:MAG: reverse transcriptase domain-containing protein, partial [Candidatus Pacebacteria bacterium]|nr:reverse transcriptase domain-containing protein [Candidatus Paceibacterota bacterium]
GNFTPETIWKQQCHALNTRFRSSETSEEKQFKSSVKNLRTFGCNVYYHLQNQRATEPRSAKGIFLGYSDEGKGYYRVLDLQSRKEVIRRDVHFDESSFTFVREYTRDRYRPFDLESRVDESRGVKEAPSSNSASMPHVGGATSSHSKPEIRSNAPVAASSSNSDSSSSSDSESEEREDHRAASSEAAARPAMAPSTRVRLMLDDEPVFESEYTKPKKQKTVFDAVRPENIITSSRRRGSARREALMMAAAALKELAESTVETEQKTDPPQESSIEEEFDDPEPQFTPKNWKQAMKCRNAAQWYKAAQHEISQMEKTGTYKLVQRPPGANVIGSSWTWAKKYGRSGKISRFRARLVARGDKQKADEDYFRDQTFAAVMRYKSLRALLAIAANLDYEIKHLDVPTAFLRAVLTDDVYMEQPEGFHNGDFNLVWKLVMSIYGIKQAPSNWNSEINSFLLSLGFTRLKTDTCIYVKRSRSGRLIAIGVFVDDLVPIFHLMDASEWDELHAALKAKYQIKDTGDASVILGMRVTRDRTARTLKLDQSVYIAKMLERYQLSECNRTDTPTSSYILSQADCPQTEEEKNQIDIALYQQMVGALNYAAISTRPDISFAVGVLSRFLQNPGRNHVTACKRVFRYLKGTAELGIVLGGTDSLSPVIYLTAYSDS